MVDVVGKIEQLTGAAPASVMPTLTGSTAFIVENAAWEQHIESFAALVKRPDLCEMEPPDISHDLSNGVVCIGCWNELAQRAGKQAAALESMSDRIAELERVLRNVREHNECPDCAAEISKALMVK